MAPIRTHLMPSQESQALAKQSLTPVGVKGDSSKQCEWVVRGGGRETTQGRLSGSTQQTAACDRFQTTKSPEELS